MAIEANKSESTRMRSVESVVWELCLLPPDFKAFRSSALQLTGDGSKPGSKPCVFMALESVYDSNFTVVYDGL